MIKGNEFLTSISAVILKKELALRLVIIFNQYQQIMA